MSDDVESDPRAAHTRHRQPELGRKSFKPISERMSRNKSGSTEDLHREPVRSSPRSPGGARKNQSTKPSGSPKMNRRSPRQQKKKLYPDLSKENRLYPDVHGNGYDEDDDNDDDDFDESDVDEDDEVDSVSYGDDSFRSGRRGSPVVKRPAAVKRPLHSSGESRHNRGQEYDRHRRDPHSKAADDTPAQTQSSVIGFLILAFGIIAFIIGGFMYLRQQPAEEPIEKSVDYFKLYKPHLDQIRAKYPSQSQRFWRVVNSSIKRLLTEKVQTYPAVLLFGIPEAGSVTGTCISKDIVKSLNDVFNSTQDGYIYSGSLNSETPGKMKRDLDDQLIKNLENGKGVVLDHIEKLPAQTALLLHGYCDGDNAPYKSAAIILGLHVDSAKPLSDRDNVIEEILNDLWEKELGIDEMPALRSRIANSVTVVNHEPDVKC